MGITATIKNALIVIHTFNGAEWIIPFDVSAVVVALAGVVVVVVKSLLWLVPIPHRPPSQMAKVPSQSVSMAQALPVEARYNESHVALRLEEFVAAQQRAKF
jgi:hypothetical protein